MMLLFGGIPDVYYDRFEVRARKELKEHSFTGVRLRPSAGKTYVVTQSHCEQLLETLLKYLKGRPRCLDDGLGIVVLLRPWETGDFRQYFFPFGLVQTVRSPSRPIQGSGTAAQIAANRDIDDMFAEARKLAGAVSAVTSELDDRRFRTPITLPPRHFHSGHFMTLLDILHANLGGSPNPARDIEEACGAFEHHHPFINNEGRKFIDDRNIRFKFPGRDLHGDTWEPGTNGHNVHCFLNSKLRLGGPITEGLHFDCTRERGEYHGSFANCHTVVADHKGKPHLNIFPNDFVKT